MSRAFAFAGRRTGALSFGEDEMRVECIWFKAVLLTEIMDRAARGYDAFYCGAGCGDDIVFGEQVLWVKATTYPHIRLICAISESEQVARWPQKWCERQRTLLMRADSVVRIAGHQACDRYMVDYADALLTVDGSEIARYARKRGREIVRIDTRAR